MKLDKSGLRERLMEMTFKQVVMKAQVCNKYIASPKVPEIMELMTKMSPDSTAKLLDLYELYTCSCCGALKLLHNSCNKYVPTNIAKKGMFDDVPCDTCGLSQYAHKICGSFVFGYEANGQMKKECQQCGKEYFHHKKNIKYCDSFKDNNFGYCTKCTGFITDHFFNKDYYNMGQEMQSEFCLKQMDFRIVCNDMENKDLVFPIFVKLDNQIRRSIESPNYAELVNLLQYKQYANAL